MKHKLSLFLIINFSLLIINCKATSYTWTGTTSTAWNTSTNWSPSGVPSTSDNVTINQASGNQPTLDTVRTITNLTLSRGTLDLGGFTLTSTGTLSVTGTSGLTREVNNGKLKSTGSSPLVNLATFGAKLELNSANFTVSSSTFNATVKLTFTGSSPSNNGGCTFNDTLRVIISGSAHIYFCNGTVADTYNAPVYYTTTTVGIFATYGPSSGTVKYNDDIHVNISGGGFLNFGNQGSTSTTTELASGKNIVFDQFSNASLTLGRFKRLGSGTWTIDQQSSGSNNISVGPYSDIPYTLELKSGKVNLTNTTFTKPVKVLTMGSGVSNSGGCTFNDTLRVTNSGTAHVNFCNGTAADTYNAPVYYTTTTAYGIYATYNPTSGTVKYNDDIHISLSGGGFLSFGAQGSTSTTTELASGKSMVFDQFSNAGLTLGRFKRLGSGTWTIDQQSNVSNYISVGPYCDIPYTLELKSGRVNLTNTTFSKPVKVLTSGSSTSGSGGCTFNDTLRVTNSGTASVYFCNGTVADTYNGPVYYTVTTAVGIYATYGPSSGTVKYNDDVHLNISGGGFLYYGASGSTTPTSELASGKNIVMDGLTGSTIYFTRFKLLGSGTLSLSGDASSRFIVGSYSEINRTLTLTAGRVESSNTTYNADATFATTGSSSSYSSGGNTFNTNLTITNSGSGSHFMGYTAADKYYGNLTATQSSTGLIYLAYTGTNELKGNLTLTQNSSSPIGNGGGTLTFNGTSNQTITKSGSVNPEFGKLTVNKASGSVIQASEVKINTTLTLSSGKLQTGSNTLHLGNGGTMSGASSSSFVEGTFKKTGNQAFTFPVGKSGIYAPLTITAPSSSTDAFTAEYVDGSPNGTYPLSQKDTSLHELDDTGYWLMSRPTGSSTPTVTVNFGIRCGTTSASTLIFAQWDATTSKWKDKGNGANTSTTLTHTGTIGWATGVKPIIVGRLTRLKVNAGNDIAYCYGSSTGLSASVTNGTSAFSYAWTPTTGLSSATVYNPTVSATSSGNYIVTVTDSRNCVAKDTVGVTVNPLPTANAGSDAAFCAGDSLSLNATGSGTTSPYTYAWSPTTALSSSTIHNPKASPSSAISYIVTVTDYKGCIKKDTVGVTVNSLPSADAGSDMEIYLGNRTYIGSSSVSGLTYSWSPSTNLSSTTVSNPIAGPTSELEYTLTVTNTYGCQDTDTVAVSIKLPFPMPPCLR